MKSNKCECICHVTLLAGDYVHPICCACKSNVINLHNNQSVLDRLSILEIHLKKQLEENKAIHARVVDIEDNKVNLSFMENFLKLFIHRLEKLERNTGEKK